MTFVFIKKVKCKCVGLSYYHGMITDELLLVRDTNNTKDKNAIEVHNEEGDMVGFIERIAAAKLAPVIDEFGDDVEMRVIHNGDKNHSWKIQLDIEVWASSAIDYSVREYLK